MTALLYAVPFQSGSTVLLNESVVTAESLVDARAGGDSSGDGGHAPRGGGAGARAEARERIAPTSPKTASDTRVVRNVRRELTLPANASRILTNMCRLWRRSFDDADLGANAVVPAMIIPTFRDGDHLRNLLVNFDTPVRHVVFINNADDDIVNAIMADLVPLRAAGAVSVFERFDNAGFSTSINLGIKRCREVLTAKTTPSSDWDLARWPLWYFIVNCDSVFAPGSARHFVTQLYAELQLPGESLRPSPTSAMRARAGLFYTGDQVDHFCFGVSESAVALAGDMDEVFHPAYMEDVDWRWRIHLAGFDDLITHAAVGHHRSVNLKRASADSPFMKMLGRSARGWEYARMKWGNIAPGRLRSSHPSSGRSTPFGIAGAPLSLYVVDPVHRACVRGEIDDGPRFVGSESCWYNGTGLLSVLPPGTRLPEYLVRPFEPMHKYYDRVEREAQRSRRV